MRRKELEIPRYEEQKGTDRRANFELSDSKLEGHFNDISVIPSEESKIGVVRSDPPANANRLPRRKAGGDPV